LWANPACPFAHRTWIAALEKEIDFEYKLIPLAGELTRLEREKKDPSEIVEELPAFSFLAKLGKTTKELQELKEWYKKTRESYGRSTHG